MSVFGIFGIRTLRAPSFLGLALGFIAVTTPIPLFFSAAQAQAQPTPTASPIISEAEVNALLEQMKAAVKKRDAKALSAYFTPDARIEMYLPLIMGGKQSLKRNEYEKMLREGWQALDASDYTYTVKNINITLYPEKDKALVSDETHESFLFAGKRVISVAKENMLIVRHQGQLKVKILKGKVKLNP
jgi:hypothetical protein